MGLFSSLKHLMGFSSDNYVEEELENGESIITSTSSNTSIQGQSSDNKNISSATPSGKSDIDLDKMIIPDEALNRLVEVMNANMPDYVRQCIDTEAQKRFICESMGDSFKNFTKEIKEKVLSSEREYWKNFKETSDEKVNKLNDTIKELKAKADESKSQLLSSERQRRALSERTHDLEAKVASCEAEVEQYILENKSLLNKLKVVQVKTDDVEYFKNENSRLLTEINKLKTEALKGGVSDTVAKEYTDRISSLESEIETLKADFKSAKDQIEELNNKNTELQESSANKDITINDLKCELEMSVKMVNEFRVKAAEALKELETVKQEAANKPEVDESKLQEYHDKLKLANDEIQSLREQLDEANENLSILDQIEQEFEKLEGSRKAEQQEAENLKSSIHELELSVKNKESENISLRTKVQQLSSQIEENTAKYSQNIKEISALYEAKIAKISQQKKESIDMDMLGDIVDEPENNYSPESPKSDKKSAKRGKSKKEENSIDIDDIMLDDDFETDWLQPTPPTPPAPKVKEEPEPEKTDPRREDNTLQMTLF